MPVRSGACSTFDHGIKKASAWATAHESDRSNYLSSCRAAQRSGIASAESAVPYSVCGYGSRPIGIT